MNLEKILKKIFSPSFYFLLTAIFLTELTSYFGFIFRDLDHQAFLIVVILVLVLSLKNIRYGVYIAILELVIGSKGYLLHINISDNEAISIRIAIWVIILAVWFKNFIFSIKEKDLAKKSVFLKPEILKRGYLNLFLLLFALIAWGGINGFWHNGFNNTFLDLNGWLYFALIFPLFECIFNKNLYDNKETNPLWAFWKIFAVGLSWLAIKTYFILFLFSHTIAATSPMHDFLVHQMYYWIRNTGIGEITTMPSGFVRVFFQSHFYLLPGFYALLMGIGLYWGEIIKNKKLLIFSVAGLSILTSLIIISFSRSFWVATVVVFPLYAFIAWKRYGPKRLLISCLLILASVLIGIGLIAGTIKFPFPKPGADFSLTDALANRAKKISNEAAVSSRYALLPELWKGIGKDPILGAGFGKNIIYKTSDPRVLENNPDGLYSTYAFEWGWLDVWLKMGIFGLILYLFIVGRLIKDAWGKETFLTDLFIVLLAIFFIVNIFTPYANHPLGIGFLLLAAATVSWQKKPCPCA